MKSLEYYYADGSHVKFNKYAIDTIGTIRNKQTGKILSPTINGKYLECCIQDDYGKRRKVRVCRALVSTFNGSPPTIEHTCDHKDRVRNNDTTENLRWATISEQNNNRKIPDINKSAFVIIKSGICKTLTEWVEHLKGHKNNLDRYYTKNTIKHY
jgi:hypothetical protein